jgi:hypothetical protein
MALTVEKESGDVWVLRISSLLRKSEQDTVQAAAAREFEAGGTVKLLVIAEDFRGWEAGADWGDMTFLVKHGNQITKIAVVADAKWETSFMMFAGAGFRRAPVKFFPAGQTTEARTWLG